MLIDSYEEFDYVRDRIAPRLEALIEQKGFMVLQWSDVGWVHFFTKTPARTPDDIRKLKLFTSAGDPEGEKLYKEFGLQVVPLAVTDMLPSLQTNLIEAFDVPPLFALLDQSFGLAKNMIDVKWAPLAGATLLSRKTWDRIPEAQRAEMLLAARAAAAGRARGNPQDGRRRRGRDAEARPAGGQADAATSAEMARRGRGRLPQDARARRSGGSVRRSRPPAQRVPRRKRPGAMKTHGPDRDVRSAVAVLALISALPLVEIAARKLAGRRHPGLHPGGAAPDAVDHVSRRGAGGRMRPPAGALHRDFPAGALARAVRGVTGGFAAGICGLPGAGLASTWCGWSARPATWWPGAFRCGWR